MRIQTCPSCRAAGAAGRGLGVEFGLVIPPPATVNPTGQISLSYPPRRRMSAVPPRRSAGRAGSSGPFGRYRMPQRAARGGRPNRRQFHIALYDNSLRFYLSPAFPGNCPRKTFPIILLYILTRSLHFSSVKGMRCVLLSMTH